MPLHEDLRYIHEDIERMTQGIIDRMLEEPKHVSMDGKGKEYRDANARIEQRNQLNQQHEIANLTARIQEQSERGLAIYKNMQDEMRRELEKISTGDVMGEFYRQMGEMKAYHDRNPDAPVEDLERRYKLASQGGMSLTGDMTSLFTGEEAFGRFLDLVILHDEFLNLPGVKGPGVKKLSYVQYLDQFDHFGPPVYQMTKKERMSDAYLSYLGSLSIYLENFIRRTKPLEDVDPVLDSFDTKFEVAWAEDKIEGWESKPKQIEGSANKANGEAGELYCKDCEKTFSNPNVYQHHLTAKKHLKNVERRKEAANGNTEMTNGHKTSSTSTQRLAERGIAYREFRIQKLASLLQTERADTRGNVERKAGLTERERQAEQNALYAMDEEEMLQLANGPGGDDIEDDEENEDGTVYNPLNLPLAWDGKPIPFWLYKLHGLGVEFQCEICGNAVYKGRRQFEKHFSEAFHTHNLSKLGINSNYPLFREITSMDEAKKLWAKLVQQKEDRESKLADIEEMEDSEGNVMSARVYHDLEKAGLL